MPRNTKRTLAHARARNRPLGIQTLFGAGGYRRGHNRSARGNNSDKIKSKTLSITVGAKIVLPAALRHACPSEFHIKVFPPCTTLLMGGQGHGHGLAPASWRELALNMSNQHVQGSHLGFLGPGLFRLPQTVLGSHTHITGVRFLPP
jgi:hypothetical protein